MADAHNKIRVNPLTQMATTSNATNYDSLPNYQSDTLNNNNLPLSQQSSPRQPIRRRVRRRANSASNDPAEQLTEMSVRGLNLFRYASVNEGIYQCTECAKENIQKTFKNKYSFQRHAFLYHEGKQRKVFPCPVCCKEFSRPDKMKNHMKTTHECYMPKDCVFPPGYFMMSGAESPIPPGMKIDSPIPHGLKIESPGIHRYLPDEDHPNATPVITLELLSRSDHITHTSEARDDRSFTESDVVRPTLILDSNSGVHFLTEDQANSLFSPKLEPTHTDGEDTEDLRLSPVRSKQELLEYLIRSDGSVVCKLCGEILQSRTHWYRHKYKFHVTPAASPAPLFRCEQCSVFFKSRKGYIGHLASRHPDNETGNSSELPPITAEPSEPSTGSISIKQEPMDAELAIPRCELPNTHFTRTAVAANPAMPNIVVNPAGVIKGDGKIKIKSGRGQETSNAEVGGVEWEKQRRREERLVADIIARVRRECEASGGTGGGTRRGYSRRSALTNG